MSDLDRYFPIAEAIASLLHPYGEVVIHDLKTGRIARIFNAFSKRKAGDESLIEESEHDHLPDVFPVYSKINWDGRRIKSSTAALRNKQGKAIGLLCINLDLSRWEAMQQFLSEWMKEPDPQPKALFKDDWREKVNAYINAFLRKESTTLKALSKEKARKLVKLLHREGAFKARNAAAFVAEVLGLSRATIYNYLREKS
jgi:predicted transcriptional regulator YheO